MSSATESSGQFARKFYRNLAGSIALAVWVQLIAGCARFQPTATSINPSPSSEMQSVTMKDTAIHYDPSVMRPGVDRNEVEQTFGEPNSSGSLPTGQTEDVYAFYPDGTKFVNPTVRPRNIALGVFTGGMSVAMRQLRLHQAESKLTLYHVIYDANGMVASVHIEPPSGGNPTPAQSQSQSQSTIGSGVE
jgi:hypothetical protein